MAYLSVNINKIATLRNSRGGENPNLVKTALKLVEMGVDGITIHPRADQRHITPQDVIDISNNIHSVERNFEGDLREEFLEMVFAHKPQQCTLVPVKPGEITSNHGWDLEKWGFLLSPIIERLRSENIRSSLFMHPEDTRSLSYLEKIKPDRIELFTEPYANAFEDGAQSSDKALSNLKEFAYSAHNMGIEINAGHDLTHINLPPLLQQIPIIKEVSIGHHLICHAIDVGLPKAVADYLDASHGSL